LKQCNDRDSLATESCKDCKGRERLSFHWDAFGIEGMVHEKTVSASFGVAVGPRLQTPGTGAAMPSHKEFQML